MLSNFPLQLSRPSLLSLPSIPRLLLLRKICACKNTTTTSTTDTSKYREAFARRMAMAGLKPHHRIALGVSGGPDSIALCVLASGWKADGMVGADSRSGWIDGILGIVVDHGLRAESGEEAKRVCDWVSKMGIRCEIRCCDWSDGKPTPGHLQEAARDMRYQIFQDVCIQHQIVALLIAHHADDQAELFILRLSRNSGVLGLSGMAFTSQLFPSSLHCYGENLSNQGILLTRPLLEFSKEDMYKICQGGNQEWVEDPTNRSPVFARNRIRMSLRNSSSRMLKSELQAIISACRQTRSFVDHTCHNLINQAVTIMDSVTPLIGVITIYIPLRCHFNIRKGLVCLVRNGWGFSWHCRKCTKRHGYAVIDLKKLDPLNIEDLCLSKFAAVILQFISQRHKPVRGSTTQLLLNYIRSYPCKTSLTAAGCYLCAAPGSKGTKILVCYSSDSPQPSRMESHKYSSEGQNRCLPSEIEQIIMKAKSYSDRLLSDILDVPFLHVTSSESILNEARKLNILSESTYESILLLRREESKHFSSQKALQPEYELKHTMKSASGPTETLQAGQLCHFMDRFFVRWNMCEKTRTNRLPADKTDFDWESKGGSQDLLCGSCVVGQNAVAVVRHMVDADWLYLAKLSNVQKSEESQTQRLLPMGEMEQEALRTVKCSDYLQLSAQSAVRALKSIPAAARRGLPVLVDPHGLLLSVPSICFKHCPYLSVNAEFKPRVPLGGGYSSYI